MGGARPGFPRFRSLATHRDSEPDIFIGHGELNMSDQSDTPSEHGDTGTQSQVLHVITLISSTVPIALPVLSAPELSGAAIFRSRRIEDGRERFRIHIGYFTSAAEAEAMLPIVRETYPWAFAGPAPQTNLGSLDDTSRSRFAIVRAPDAAPAAPVKAAPAKPMPAKPAPAAARPSARVASIPPAMVAAQALRKPPASRSPSPPKAAGAVPPVLPVAAQRYAVQLLWSKEPIDLSKIPNIGIFAGYLLYAVETEPGRQRMFGVRLGFYDDALSARLVALYVRPAFKGVVVPVSEREVSMASRATIQPSAARPVRGRTSPREAWPHAAVSVPFAPTAVQTMSDPL
jgi:hypothetical protein